MLIINAKIMTVETETIVNGYVHVNHGVIADFGAMKEIPVFNETDVIDAQGAILLPGFIDAHCHVGLNEDSLGFEGNDVNETTDPVAPQLRAIDGVNIADICFKEALCAGVTTAIVSPGSQNPIGGQIFALKTHGIRIDDMIIKSPIGIKMAFGENPKRVYSAKAQTPSTRMATASIIRTTLCKAKIYMDEKADAVGNKEKAAPDFNEKYEALIPLLKGEIKAHIHAHRADDIFTAIRVAKEFNIHYVLVHATESYMIADIMAKEKSEIIVGPYLNSRSKVELKNLSPASPGILEKAHIKPAICTDHSIIPLQYLPLCAGIAVREGMSFAGAIEAITLTPARICGISDRVGSIAVGKDADLVLFDQDPLSIYARPRMVFVNGIRVK